MSPNQMAGYLRSFGYSDGDLVDAICSQCIDSLLASMMRKDYSGFLNDLHSINQSAFDDLCNQLSVPSMLSLNDKITMIIGSSNPANSAGILSNGGHLQCSEILSIFDWMFVLGSSLSNNQLDSVNGVKACYKGALGEAELVAAMEHTLGYSAMWDRIFAEEPGTEDEYIHHIRQNQPDLFLYHALLVLNDYGYLDNIAYNLNGVYIGPWLDAVKNHFGEDYYNSYIAKLLPGNYSSSWVYKLNEQHIYGSSRLGLIERNLTLIRQKHGDEAWNYITTENDTVFVYNYTSDSIKYRNRGEKRYELSNHLGNVLAVITDRRIQACETGELMHYEAQIVQVTDYYPFGSIVEKRVWRGKNGYRFGFNGMEEDDEVKGAGNSLDFGARIYDSRLGRWLSVDPLWGIFPNESHYVSVSNNPIIYFDKDGNSKYITYIINNQKTGEYIEIKILVDNQALERVYDDKLGLENFAYYDINEVHRITIDKNGNEYKSIKTERGDYRAKTLLPSNSYANWLKTETKEELALDEGMTGIRWTTKNGGSAGHGNSRNMKRKFERSENIDLLLSTLSQASRTGSSNQKTYSIPDILTSTKDALETGQSIRELLIDVNDEMRQEYDASGHGCNSCEKSRHGTNDYKDKAGNVMDGETGDTLTKPQKEN